MEMEVFLPTEIISEILTRLPADSAIRCRGICKQWRSLIDHPSFRDTHTRQVISSSSYNQKEFGIPNSSSSGFFLGAKQGRHSLELNVIEYNDAAPVGDTKSVLEFKPSKPITGPPFRFSPYNWGDLMISSCNGLVLMGSNIPNYINDMVVCNLFTREYVNLRSRQGLENQKHEDGICSMAYGFGYHPCTNEYKVVRIFYPLAENTGNVSVYTLGSRKWRSKGKIPYCLHKAIYPGMLANGAIHWYTDSSGIVSFDLAEEEFRVVVPFLPLPSPITCVDQYGVLGGCLCVTVECEGSGDIWVLSVRTTNNKQAMEELSWNKKFSIPWRGISTCAKPQLSWKRKFSKPWKGITCAKPQVVTNSGKILLSGGRFLVSFDPKTEAFVYEDIFPNCGWGKLTTYTKSFVSLKALGEEDVKSWRSIAHAQALAQLHNSSNSEVDPE